jgi:predicted nucleic acid-binding protein
LKYCIDTSALLDGWVRWYPPDTFQTLWDNIGALIDNGIMVAPEEVFTELAKKDDDVYKWAKKNKSMFLSPVEDIQIATAEILNIYPRLVDSRKDRSQADPFVIAVARVHNLAVVTEEKGPGTEDRPKIPNVCAHFGIKYMRLLDMIRDQGWRF